MVAQPAATDLKPRVARLSASAVASIGGFDIDLIDDIKLAVSEALLALIELGSGGTISATFEIDGPTFNVTASSKTARTDLADADLDLCRTVLAGVILGVLVTLTSIGSGALGTVLLVYLYPVRLNAGRLVGTDIAHAIPLSLIAGLGHLSLGNLDSTLLVSLLLGSIPGVLVGSLVGARAPVALIRTCIACVLLAVATRMLAV